MRTTARWAFMRQLQYGSFFAVIFIGIFTYGYFQYLYAAPTCFNNTQDGEEAGIDCGGACVRICAFSVAQPTIRWTRSFKITDGQYNAVAYVENSNRLAATKALKYTFSLYDDAGLIIERSGETILPPDSVYPIFEGRILTGDRIPTRTFLELQEPEVWQPADQGRDQFVIIDRNLTGADDKPKLYATLENTSLEEAREVEVVATVFDVNGNALTSSRTSIDNFAPRSETDVVFTWLEPIAKTVRSCEIPTDVMLAIDLSGSMNNDSDNPPQPVTDVIEAAGAFVSRLGDNDQVGVVTFATDAQLVLPLSLNKSSVAGTVRSLTIAPESETGSTNTGDALKVGGFELISERHNSNARKVMVLLTDGLATAPDENPEEYALGVAQRVKEEDIELYVIGLGEAVNMEFVRTLASAPEQAYQALSRTDIDTIYKTITSSLCEEGVTKIDVIPKTDASFTPLQ